MVGLYGRLSLVTLYGFLAFVLWKFDNPMNIAALDISQFYLIRIYKNLTYKDRRRE